MWLGEAEEYRGFVRLVQEFLPDKEKTILAAEGVAGMVAAFAREFQNRYFPMPWFFTDGEAESFNDLLCCIPISVMGMGYEDYDDLVDRGPSEVLSTLLVDFESELNDFKGLRVVLMEKAVKLVPPQLLMKLPEQGYSLDYLKEVLESSPHKGLLYWAQYLCHTTDIAYLDTDDEMAGQQMEEWSRENVEWLTEDWRKAEEMIREMDVFHAWLKADLENHFGEIVSLLSGGTNEQIDPRQLRLPLETTEGAEDHAGSAGVPGGHPQRDDIPASV